MFKDLLPHFKFSLQFILSAKWRAATFILILILGFMGVIIYMERHTFIQLWFDPQQRTVVDPAKFERLANYYLPRSDADVAILWKIRMSRNQRISLVYTTKHAGRIEEVENNVAPVFTGDIKGNEYVLRMLNGEIFCGELITTSTVGRFLIARGITTLCRAGVLNDGLLIGYITFGYRIPPENFEQVKTDMRAMVGAVTSRVPRRVAYDTQPFRNQ